jgi:hypothetical protein
MVMAGKAHALMVTLHTHITGGQGLAPARTVPPIQNYCNSNNLFNTYILRKICGHTDWVALPKALPLLGGRRVESRQLPKI